MMPYLQQIVAIVVSIIGYLIVMVDNVQTRKLQFKKVLENQKLRRSYENLFEHFPQGVMIVNKLHMKIVLINEELQRFLKVQD